AAARIGTIRQSEDGKTVVVLACGEKEAALLATRQDREALDIVVKFDPVDSGKTLRCHRVRGIGVDTPDRHLVLGDIELASAIIGSAPFGAAAEVVLAQDAARWCGAREVERNLLDDSLFIDHEGINAASAEVETQSVGLSNGRIDAADFDEARSIRVQAEEAEAWTIPVAAVRRGDERRSLTGERHVGAQVDIVEIAE